MGGGGERGRRKKVKGNSKKNALNKNKRFLMSFPKEIFNRFTNISRMTIMNIIIIIFNSFIKPISFVV